MDRLLEKLSALLGADCRVCVLTGAGISAESGIPTFRDAQTGLWAQYRPEDLATPQAFERNPRLVWCWYRERRARVLEVQPNPGHRALVELAARVGALTLITQNVDGLHQRAGSREVIELHGSLGRSICHRTLKPVSEGYVAATPGEPPPSPHHREGLVRPDVVWFGELLRGDVLDRAFTAARDCDVFFSIGTSAVVEPAASLALAAREAGAHLVEVNRDTTPLSRRADTVLKGPAGEILPRLIAALG